MGCFLLGKYLGKYKCKQFYQFIFACRSKPWSCFVNKNYIHTFLYLVLSNLLLVLTSLWCHKFFPHAHTVLWYIYIYICNSILTLKAYIKMRRAADIINHSSSERRSIFNTSLWSKLSNVTGCFTVCIDVHSPAVELENAIQFRLWSGPLLGLLGTCSTAPNTLIVLVISFKTRQGLEC